MLILRNWRPCCSRFFPDVVPDFVSDVAPDAVRDNAATCGDLLGHGILKTASVNYAGPLELLWNTVAFFS